MTPVQTLLALRREQATIAVVDGRLSVKAETPIPVELVAAVKEHRDALLRLLTAEVPPTQPSCACGRTLLPWELERTRCSVCVNNELAAAGLPIQVAVWDVARQSYRWQDAPDPALAIVEPPTIHTTPDPEEDPDAYHTA